MTLASKIFINLCTKGDAKKNEGLKTPEDILRFDNISYAEHGEYSLLDVYRPKSAEKPLPVIISIHGGGYVYGNKEVYQFYCMSLAQHGFCVINFNYRLAPMWEFPAPLEDCCAVLRWMLESKDEYLFDTDNVFTVGDSAGAQLNSQLAAMLCSPQYAALFGFDVPKLALRAVALNCGMYDICKKGRDSGFTKDYFGKSGPDADERREVLKYIGANYPPVCIMSANGDFLNKHLKPMTELLISRNIETFSKLYGDPKKRDLGHVFHVNIKDPAAIVCNNEQCGFFKEHVI